MKALAEMSVGELAAFISSHLGTRQIEVILSGGSCVSIYGDGQYVTDDLDFIDTRFATMREIRDAMAEIGNAICKSTATGPYIANSYERALPFWEWKLFFTLRAAHVAPMLLPQSRNRPLPHT